jgi:hypothetical protein
MVSNWRTYWNSNDSEQQARAYDIVHSSAERKHKAKEPNHCVTSLLLPFAWRRGSKGSIIMCVEDSLTVTLRVGKGGTEV